MMNTNFQRLELVFVAEQAGLSLTRLQTTKTGFLNDMDHDARKPVYCIRTTKA